MIHWIVAQADHFIAEDFFDTAMRNVERFTVKNELGLALCRLPRVKRTVLFNLCGIHSSCTVGASACGTKHCRQRASYMPSPPTATRSSDSKVR